MVWMYAIDAETENRIASKAISTRRHHAAETKWKTLLVRAVEGRRYQEVKGAWSLLNDDQRPGECNPCRHPSTDKRVGGNQGEPVREPHVRAVCGAGLHPGIQGQMETVHGDDGARSAQSSSRRLTRGTWDCGDHARGVAETARQEGQGAIGERCHASQVPAPVRLRSGSQRRGGGGHPCHYPLYAQVLQGRSRQASAYA